jgi:trehalose/maltose hydrolase-like predicted phosphorylase
MAEPPQAPRRPDAVHAAVVLAWNPATGAWPEHRVAELRARVSRLCALGVDIALIGDEPVPRADRRLGLRPSGPGLLLLCRDADGAVFDVDGTGIRAGPCDGRGASAAEDAVLGRLGKRGIGAGTVLVADARHASDALRVLDEQIRLRRGQRVPAVDLDEAWTIVRPGPGRSRQGATESLFTLGAGGIGVRGSVEEEGQGSAPLVLAAGIYTGSGSEQHPMPAPTFTGLSLTPVPVRDVRVLDMRTGVLLREEGVADRPLRTLRFVSVARPGVAAMRAEAAPGRIAAGSALRAVSGHVEHDVATGRDRAVEGTESGISAVAAQRSGECDGVGTVERLAAYVARADRRPAPAEADTRLAQAQRSGFDRLLAEHRLAWARRWNAVDVRIAGDPHAQRDLRFALFQLWSNVDPLGEGAVGARGLSGSGYRGHVFWDAEAFVLPAIVSMNPGAALAMLGYRLRRLPAAKAFARRLGRRGARFPWESAAQGIDVTPDSAWVRDTRVAVRTGTLEEHITADVAWAAWHYAQWSGDRTFLAGAGRELLVETARYWADRCRVDALGRAHIDAVTGPDEYHEPVDDNAFTNVMARWNLRQGARLLERDPAAADQALEWRRLADALVDGYHDDTGRYEQFAGYFGLRSERAADIAPAPMAADVLMGQQRVAGSQIIKQPDVLMLHHLVPDEVAAGSLVPNLEFYGPRTAHGSSLSPSVSAILLARAGRPDEALDLLRMALALDLEDLTGSAATGLHLGSLGGAWQCVLAGFAGIRVRAGVLEVDPVLPGRWQGLEVRFRCLGRGVRVAVNAETVEIEADGPIRARIAGQPACQLNGRARVPR